MLRQHLSPKLRPAKLPPGEGGLLHRVKLLPATRGLGLSADCRALGSKASVWGFYSDRRALGFRICGLVRGGLWMSLRSLVP